MVSATSADEENAGAVETSADEGGADAPNAVVEKANMGPNTPNGKKRNGGASKIWDTTKRLKQHEAQSVDKGGFTHVCTAPLANGERCHQLIKLPKNSAGS
jgi:hypothetical protein